MRTGNESAPALYGRIGSRAPADVGTLVTVLDPAYPVQYGGPGSNGPLCPLREALGARILSS